MWSARSGRGAAPCMWAALTCASLVCGCNLVLPLSGGPDGASVPPGDGVTAGDGIVAVDGGDVALGWSRVFGGSSSDEGSGVAVDGQGNVTVTGFFQNSMDLGGAKLTSAGAPDVFLVTFDAGGSLVRQDRFGGSSTEKGTAVAADATGSITLTGSMNGGVDFGGGPLSDGGDLFVARFDADGNHLRSWALDGGIYPARNVALAPNGDAIVGGSFVGTLILGGTTLSDAGGFVARYAPEGTLLWAVPLGSSKTNGGKSVAVDGNGNVAVFGTFFGTLNLGNDTLTSAGNSDLFVASLDSGGTPRWARRIGVPDLDQAYGVAMDQQGYTVVTGYFTETADFGGSTLTSVGSSDMFVARYAPDGNLDWALRGGGTGKDIGRGVAVDPAGNIVVAGSFRKTADFGGKTLDAGGDNVDIFVASYTPGGAHRWSYGFGGGAEDRGEAVAVDAKGNVAVTGTVRDSVDFGDGPHEVGQYTDIFVLWLAAQP